MKSQSRSKKKVPVAPADRDYVSVSFWMFAQLLLLTPVINVIIVPILAFVGSNRSRKNFFRAMMLWLVLIFALHIALILLLMTPAAWTQLKEVWALILETLWA